MQQLFQKNARVLIPEPEVAWDDEYQLPVVHVHAAEGKRGFELFEPGTLHYKYAAQFCLEAQAAAKCDRLFYI
jgi:hypothetical protein